MPLTDRADVLIELSYDFKVLIELDSRQLNDLVGLGRETCGLNIITYYI